MTMKMISKTSITSTIGVTLMALITAAPFDFFIFSIVCSCSTEAGRRGHPPAPKSVSIRPSYFAAAFCVFFKK